MQQQHDCLQIPILGSLSREELANALKKSILSEATAADFYTRLLNQAPNKLHHTFIEHARDDELEHLCYFQKLYCFYFEEEYQYNVNPVSYSYYKDGILKALLDEQEAAEFYRNIQLSVTDQLIRDTFYLAMVDEMEHATKFSTLLNQLK